MLEQLINLREDLFNGEKIRFRPITDTDKPIIKTAYATSSVAVGCLSPYFRLPSDQELEKMLDSWKITDPTTGFYYAIENPQGELIGDICLYGLKPPLLSGTVALAIHPTHQGKGYGHEAMRMALQLAFTEYNAHKVELTVYAYNDPAINLYRKLGFQEEGRRRDSIYHQGTYYDTVWMGILRPEWEATQQ